MDTVKTHKYKLILLGLVSLLIVAVPRLPVFAASTITVNSTADDIDDDGECTLREAITAANTDTASGATLGECVAGDGAGDTIAFDIPGAGPHTITPGSALPNLSTSLTIDGYTQDGASPNTNPAPQALNGTLVIELDLSTSLNVTVTGANVVISGLVINNAPSSHGIVAHTGGSGLRVEGSYIGTDVDGLVDEGNAGHGILTQTADNVFGGTDPEDRNLISGNSFRGIQIASTAANNTIIQGNLVGTDKTGNTALGNGTGGIMNTNGDNTTIGGTVGGAQNVVSGNSATGIAIIEQAENATIQGNYVGIGSNGTTDVGNSDNGISLQSAGNTVGGTTSSARNIVSGNTSTGIAISDDNNNTIQGNYIGTNAAGTAAVANDGNGIYLYRSSSNTIGGDAANERNVISGNGVSAVALEESDNNTISGNYIGTNAAGTTALANSSAHGIVRIFNQSSSNTIGGNTADERNVIAGNASTAGAVRLVDTGTDDNVVSGNYIGVAADGTTALGNTSDSVRIDNGASRNIIGGTNAADANIIANSTNDNGVTVTGNTTLDNAILRNSIYDNSLLPIDLGDDGTTANDAGDPDTGPNDLLNKPLWNSLEENGGNTDINYSLDVPAGEYRIEFFSSLGRTFLGSHDITHPGGGSEDFDHTVTGTGHSGLRLTATEIDNDNTSGFGPTSEMGGPSPSAAVPVVVNSSADDQDDDGECTLREAITAVNTGNPSGSSEGECGIDGILPVIHFDITSNEGAGPHTITPNSALPAITTGVVIDGYTEDGGAPNTNPAPQGLNGTLVIEIDGSNTSGANGLVLNESSIVQGLVINNFDHDGIQSNSDAVIIQGNYIGTNVAGSTDAGNGSNGVSVNEIQNIIGGTDPADRNLISGNSSSGVQVSNTNGTDIFGNIIGLDVDGETDLSNNHGINISNSQGIEIGSGTSDGYNVVSGNSGTGITLAGGNMSIVQGNYVGLASDGSTAVGNSEGGISVGNGSVTIGGTTSGARNVISGNSKGGCCSHGISFYGDDGATQTVQGNYIGVNAAGTAAVPNSHEGINLFEADVDLTIGGTTSGAGNVISGNGGNGVGITTNAGTLTIQGNYIGVNAAGNNAIANGTNGIRVDDVSNVAIGGTAAGARNVVSGNGSNGINIGSATDGAAIRGNYIGVSVSGNSALGNTNNGIAVSADDVTIGGTASSDRNVVSGNGNQGIEINSGAAGTIIQGNYIGLGDDGSTDVGNTVMGISISGTDIQVGGTASGTRNVLSGNGGSGVNINTNDNTVQGNYIGLTANGTGVVANGHANASSVMIGGSNNVIGGGTPAARNVIASGGVSHGLQITGTTLFGGGPTSGNVVQGNYIGTNTDGELENGFEVAVGIGLFFDTLNNVVGGDQPGQGNVIAGGTEGIVGMGVSGFSVVPLNNSVLGNSIYDHQGGSIGGGLVTLDGVGIDWLDNPSGDFSTFTEVGPTANDAGDPDTGPQDFLNKPVINSTNASPGELEVNVSLDVPDDADGYRIEFFANDNGDPSGFGEGQTYLGHVNVPASVTNHSATITLSPGVITSGNYDITATTTEIDDSDDGFGATSEFSAVLSDQEIIQSADSDGDGVPDAVENAGPNGGDANDDGTPDAEQGHVATTRNADDDNWLTLELDPDGACNQIEEFIATHEADQAFADSNYNYPLGLNSFTIPCDGSVDGTIYYHEAEGFNDYTYRKFGPTTPGDIGTNAWYDSNFVLGQATVGSNTVATASFTLTDGQLGDDTDDDGVIVDDNGPGVTQPGGGGDNGSSSDGQNQGSIVNWLAATGRNPWVLAVISVLLIMLGVGALWRRQAGQTVRK